MRKEIVVAVPASADADGSSWMNLELHACVRLTSEDSDRPIESALQDGAGTGWRAAHPGPQTIWIDFDVPQPVREIYLQFETTERRTQQFVLQSSTDGGRSYSEIVRQQFVFSPESTVREVERYFPHLNGVTDLKLTIIPDISGGEARATLRTLRLR